MIQRSYSLTFSRRNQHIKRILEEKKNQGEIISDYVCRAIEFYEKNQNADFSNNIDSEYITKGEARNLINSSIENFFATTLNKKGSCLEQYQGETKTVLLGNPLTKKNPLENLETKGNFIDIEED